MGTCADLYARARVGRRRGRLTLVRLVLCGLRAFFTRRNDAQSRSGTQALSMGPLRVHSATGSCRCSVKSTCQATATAPNYTACADAPHSFAAGHTNSQSRTWVVI